MSSFKVNTSITIDGNNIGEDLDGFNVSVHFSKKSATTQLQSKVYKTTNVSKTKSDVKIIKHKKKKTEPVPVISQLPKEPQDPNVKEERLKISICNSLVPIENTRERLTDNFTEDFWLMAIAFESRTYRKTPWSPIFSTDKARSKGEGSKYFTTTSYMKMFKNILIIYKNWKKADSKGNRWLPGSYEIVEPHRPCNIFLDMEFDIFYNQGKNGFELLGKFLIDFKSFMTLCDIIGSEGRECETLILYSPNAKKFSFHVHILGNNWAMENIFHVGSLVRNFVMWVIKKYGNNLEEHPYFFKSAEEGNTIRFFADLAIYTSNRNFRGAYCAKGCGKDGKLPLMKMEEWNKIGMDEKRLHEITPNCNTFLKSMPCYFPPMREYRIIRCNNPDGSISFSNANTSFFLNNGNMYTYGGSTNFVKEGDACDPICILAEKIIMEYIKWESKTYFVSHHVDTNAVTIGTFSRICPIKLKRTKGANGVHKGNHTYYVVHYVKGYINIKCSDDDCIAESKRFRQNISTKWQDLILECIPPSLGNIDDNLFVPEVDLLLHAIDSELKKLEMS